MARRLRDKNGNVVRIELTRDEMAKALGVDSETLSGWTALIPALRGSGEDAVYGFEDAEQLKLYKKRASILRTQMSETAVANIERQGLLDAYASLAEDCPDGMTVHVWRSYGVVVLMQLRYGLKLDKYELARRAGLTEVDENGKRVLGVKTADRHLRLLTGLRWLEDGDGPLANLAKEDRERWAGQWRHQGLPKAWRGMV